MALECCCAVAEGDYAAMAFSWGLPSGPAVTLRA